MSPPLPPPPDQGGDTMYLPPPPPLPVFENNYSGAVSSGRGQYDFDELDHRPEVQRQVSLSAVERAPESYIEKGEKGGGPRAAAYTPGFI